MDYIIDNPYIGENFEYHFTGKPDLEDLVYIVEKISGLKLIAKSEDDELNGFVSMIPSKEGFFVVISLYGVNKESNEDSSCRFIKTELTNDVKEAFKEACKLYE